MLHILLRAISLQLKSLKGSQMGIYIKDMQMPRFCEECVIVSECEHNHVELVIDTNTGITTRLIKDNCPMVEMSIKTGKWIKGYADELQLLTTYTCSECKSMELSSFKFCPNCGADMRGNKK